MVVQSRAAKPAAEREKNVNKQQALEAILRKVRGWEEPSAEVRHQDESYVLTQLRQRTEWLVRRRQYRSGDAAEKRELVAIAAAALYLLVDEVTLVEGRTLEEWLSSDEDARLAMFARGETRVVVEHA